MLNIIEANDEKKEESPNKTRDSFYLRKSTFVTPSLSVGKKHSHFDTNKIKNDVRYTKNQKFLDEKLTKEKTITIKNSIEETFEKIKTLEELCEHPFKKNVTAKNVYSLKPFVEVINTQFSEVLFDIDPATDIDKYNTNPPKSFLLKFKKNNLNNCLTNPQSIEDDKIASLYKESSHNNNNFNENDSQENNENYDKNYYDYERDYRYQMCPNYEIFNTALIFLNKQDQNALYLPMDRKFMLKKYKKKEIAVNKDEFEEEKKVTKSEKEIIIIPVPLTEVELAARNEYFDENGIKLSYVNKVGNKKDLKIRIARNIEEKKVDVVNDAGGNNEYKATLDDQDCKDLFEDDDEEK